MAYEKKFTEKIREAKDADELIDLARNEGIDLSKQQANEIYDYVNAKQGEISDEELDNVTGGGCSLPPDSGATPLFKVGQIVYYSEVLDGKHALRVIIDKVSSSRVKDHWINGTRSYWEYEVHGIDGKMIYGNKRTCYEPCLSLTKDE